MNKRKSLTTQAHDIIKHYLNSGDCAIDATVGNGHDTFFLSNLVGKQGTIFGFDCQIQAIETTRNKLLENNSCDNTQLFHVCHSQMETLIPLNFHRKINAILFNLGYLPGSDKSVITHADSTLAALNHAIKLVSSSGIISITAYPGHSGGDIETRQVEHWCHQLNPIYYDIQTIYSSEKATAPRLIIIKKHNDSHSSPISNTV